MVCKGPEVRYRERPGSILNQAVSRTWNLLLGEWCSHCTLGLMTAYSLPDYAGFQTLDPGEAVLALT